MKVTKFLSNHNNNGCVFLSAAGAREDAVPHATERPNGARLPQVQRGQYQYHIHLNFCIRLMNHTDDSPRSFDISFFLPYGAMTQFIFQLRERQNRPVQ